MYVSYHFYLVNVKSVSYKMIFFISGEFEQWIWILFMKLLIWSIFLLLASKKILPSGLLVVVIIKSLVFLMLTLESITYVDVSLLFYSKPIS